MSEENVEVVRGVRIPLTVSSKARRRSHLERILVRFPVLFRLLAFAWSRLPPRSRLRGRLTAHLFRQGHEAANRRDFEVLLLSLDPEIEFCTDESATSLIAPDLLGVHRGYEGYVHIWRAVMDAARGRQARTRGGDRLRRSAARHRPDDRARDVERSPLRGAPLSALHHATGIDNSANGLRRPQ
jgi:hypothetical protein